MATTLISTERDEQTEEQHTRNLAALTGRVESIKNAKVDAVASTRALKAITALGTDGNVKPQVCIELPNGVFAAVGEVAHNQFADRLKIAKPYYDRMVAEAPQLLAQNLNYWFTNTPEDRLLRFLRPEAYEAAERDEMVRMGAALKLRGVLGKGYRTIDDADLIAAILPTLIEQGAKLHEFSIDDRRMHAAFYTNYRTVQDVQAEYAAKHGVSLAELQARHGHLIVGGRDIAFVNETIATGVTIRHSEVGFASLGAAFVTKVLKCLNRMVADNSIAIRHVGGKNGSANEDVRYLSDATQLMENAALLGRVQDTIAREMTPDVAYERTAKLLTAKVEEVKLPTDKPLFEFVGNIGANLGFTEAQVETLKEETTRSMVEEGGSVRFAFVQGITATARQMTDYDRRLEVERAAFTILNDDASALLALGRTAERNAKRRTN